MKSVIISSADGLWFFGEDSHIRRVLRNCPFKQFQVSLVFCTHGREHLYKFLLGGKGWISPSHKGGIPCCPDISPVHGFIGWIMVILPDISRETHVLFERTRTRRKRNDSSRKGTGRGGLGNLQGWARKGLEEGVRLVARLWQRMGLSMDRD